MKRQSTGVLGGKGTTLCDTVMVDIYHCTFAQTHRIYNTE